jgi:hypothetical protein
MKQGLNWTGYQSKRQKFDLWWYILHNPWLSCINIWLHNFNSWWHCLRWRLTALTIKDDIIASLLYYLLHRGPRDSPRYTLLSGDCTWLYACVSICPHVSAALNVGERVVLRSMLWRLYGRVARLLGGVTFTLAGCWCHVELHCVLYDWLLLLCVAMIIYCVMLYYLRWHWLRLVSLWNKVLLLLWHWMYVCVTLSSGWDSGLPVSPARGVISRGVGIGHYSKLPF